MKQAMIDKLIHDSIEFMAATIDHTFDQSRDRKIAMTRQIKGNKATMNTLKKSFDKHLERKTKDWRMKREEEQLKKIENTMTRGQIRRDKQLHEERQAARR